MTVSIKTVLVTGGASGIGRAFVERMSEQGWRVVVVDMNESALAELASDTISTFVCDVAILEQVKATVIEITESVGSIDRLIHCAAIMPAGKLATMPAATTNLLMTVNYGGTVNVVQTVLQDMLEQAMATAQPRMLRYSLENKRYMTPDDIVDAVETGLRKNLRILWPSMEAKILQWLRRFSPRLLWKIINAAN